MSTQLTLNLKLRDDATFNNFYPANNKEIIAYLKNMSSGKGEQCIYIYGQPGSGRSHLLQACCHHAIQQGLAAIYLPLRRSASLSTEILENLENITLVCLDDIDNVVGQSQWEEKIFHFFNQLRQQQHFLLTAANTAPKNLNFLLPDLKSRLNWGLVLQLQSMTDEQKINTLCARAKARGINLPVKVSKYLLNTCSRNNSDLFAILDQLDQASLTAQRKLTIPFIKKVLFLK